MSVSLTPWFSKQERKDWIAERKQLLKEQYHKHKLPTRQIFYIHHGGKDSPLYYPCKLCKFVYQHWLVEDSTWQTLPMRLWNEKLCPGCFCCVKSLTKSCFIDE